MVGVPGRSKACNTCRQRKVSCSLEKPECRTCVKASRVCTGYQRERIFLLDQRTAGDGPKSYRKSNSPTHLVTERKRKAMPIPRNDRVYQSVDYSGDTVRLISPSTLSAYRKQILSNFLFNTLPESYQLGNSYKGSDTHSGSWFAMLPYLPEMTRALETSIMAIGIAKLGRIKNDPAFVRESLKFYTRGLIELQHALWDPKLMYRDETLAACMSLVLYEVLECPDQTIVGWQSHMRGCVKLVELKGAGAYNSDFGHQIFLSFRIMEIQLALTERRSTYLADTDWVDQPFKGHIKSSFHRFLDIMATLPSIIAEGYRLIEPFVTSKSVDPQMTILGLLELLDRCWTLDKRFRAFYAELEKSNLGPIYWPNLSGITDDEDEDHGMVFPVSFHFPNLQMAHLCMLYWAASSILWSGMAYSYKVHNAFQANMNLINLPPLEHRTDVASLARNICQSLEYCTGEEHRGLGTTASIFPLKVAIETFHDAPGCERELAWATSAMKKIGEGVRIMNSLGVPLTDHGYLPG